MTVHQFTSFGKIPRWTNTTMTVTEKIDGTNAAIYLDDDGNIVCQSRKRIITPDDDNFGFATWAYGMHDALWGLLGPGLHFGEWYGKGIQRGYGLDEKRFALFNTHRHADLAQRKTDLGLTFDLSNVETVPVLYEGPLRTDYLETVITALAFSGSRAVPGWMDVEGAMAYLSNLGYVKIPFDDGTPKSEQMAVAA